MPEEKRGVNWRAWVVGILAALVLIVALQNSQRVHVDILFVNLSAPLIVVILMAAAIGAVIGYVGPLVRRHRREGHAQDR
ncbi:MAG TPA: LapA family protein [Solirubrobacterales bacterium]|nr:LapA family protein [Solirubrobacterales bacterium]